MTSDPSPQYISMQIDGIMADNVAICDLFVQLSDHKYIQIIKKGNSLTDSVLENLRSKGVTNIYIHASEFDLFMNSQLSSIRNSKRSTTPITNPALRAIASDLHNIWIEFEKAGINPLYVKHAKVISHEVIQSLRNKPDITHYLEQINTLGPTEMRHGLSVMALAIMLAMSQGWVSGQVLEKIALGALVHDIGKTILPKDILMKKTENLSNDDQIILKSHVESGRMLLEKSSEFHSDVILMVFEHHEKADGSGYPQGIRDLKISPLGRVLACANALARKLKENGFPKKAESFSKGVNAFLQDHKEHYNKTLLRSLESLL